ncbi:MAG: ImmA/IrrE family metallo-endopeptidase [Balneolaceae bacterium]|nr:ImmA/IrrE family metallo-endopeptidase [Balneolaceae bacterium]
MSTRVKINNDLITWAIDRADYELPKFIEEKFPQVEDWIHNKKKPTIIQLRDFAKKVHLPFGYLFLDTPPKEKLPIPYYRTLKGKTNEVSLNVREVILTLEKRQGWLRDYLIDNENNPLDFVGKYDKHTDNHIIINDIRKILGFNEYWSEEISSWRNAKNHLKNKFEDAGIFIVSSSYVGLNTRRKITVEECRGFVLVDQYAPFMFINSADSLSAQIFTLIHELAHLWIGESAGFDFSNFQPSENDVEKKCNEIAAEFLAPAELFNGFWKINEDFKWLAERFKVSPIVAARRALDLDKISKRRFFDFYNAYTKEFDEKEKNNNSNGNFYNSLKSKLNSRFLSLVDRAVKEDQLLYQDAFELTGLRGKTYDKAIKKLNA